MTRKLILIKNGNVIDSTGQPSYKSDILISEDKIIEIIIHYFTSHQKLLN